MTTEQFCRLRSRMAARVVPFLLACGLAATVHAGEISGVAYGGPGASNASGDGLVLSTARLSYRADHRLSLVATGLLGYGSRHRRLLTGVGAGARLGTRVGILEPYVLGGLVHQHERPLRSAGDDILGTAFGSGDDILRRTGANAAAGVDVPLWRFRGLELFSSAEVWATHFFEGPDAVTYWGASVGLGARLDLAHAAFASDFR